MKLDKTEYDIMVFESKEEYIDLIKKLAESKSKMIPFNQGVDPKTLQPYLDILVIDGENHSLYRADITLSQDVNSGLVGSDISWDQDSFIVSKV